MSGLMPAAGLSESAPGFHVFAIRPRLGAGQVEGALDANTKQYSTRKSHRKSRLGCNACKQKRVKCDEKQPRCGRCERTKKPCGYSSSGSLTQATSDCVGASKGHATNSNRRTDCSYATPIPYPLEKSNRDIHLLKHYDRITGLEQDTVTCSDILVGSQASNYRMSVLRLAQEHSYLLHAILAVSALHFNHFDVEGYRLAKFSHLQIALSDLQSAISGPITQRQADPVLLASMMINMQYFSWIESVSPSDSWVFSKEPSRLSWLSTQMALLPLVNSTRQYHTDSLLLPIWMCSAYDGDETLGLPDELLVLCGLSDTSTQPERERNPYYHALRMLGPLMLEEKSSRSMVKYVRYISSLTKPFFVLLQQNDPLALLILGYWFGLMCHVDFWWVIKRAKRDCTAICMYLDAHGDEAVRSLLEFPAGACGYQLARGH